MGSDSSLTSHSASDPLIDPGDNATDSEGEQRGSDAMIASGNVTEMHIAPNSRMKSMDLCDVAGFDAISPKPEGPGNITYDAATDASTSAKDQDGFTIVTKSTIKAIVKERAIAEANSQKSDITACSPAPINLDQTKHPHQKQREDIRKIAATTASEIHQQQVSCSEPWLPGDDALDTCTSTWTSGTKAAGGPAGSTAAAAADEVQQREQDQRASKLLTARNHDQVQPQFKQGLGCPTGVRVFTDPGVDLDSRQNPLIETFAVVTMAIYLGMIHILLLLLLAAVFHRTALATMIVVWCTLLLPAKLLWEPFLGNPVWTAWRRYFRFSVIMDQDMELHNTRYVIPEYPHGVFPLSQLIAISLTWIWPNHPIYSIAADSVFHIPLWKQVMTWIGALPATRDNFRKLLTKGSVGLIPGGIAEMFMVEDDREVIKLMDRKGFVRIAVEMGAPLLPCYHFGNSRLFKWGPKSWEPAARRHRVALGFLFGRWGLPFALPNRVPLMMVVGAPIPVEQVNPHTHPEGFAAAVDEAHAKLVTAMQQLYDKYKGVYGWADRPLVIK